MTKRVYEVQCCKAAELRIEEMEEFTRKADAMRYAREKAKVYGFVEVNYMVYEIDEYGDRTYYGDEDRLIVSFTNGKENK